MNNECLTTQDSSRFINRELSWLSFNDRVLTNATRSKYSAISDKCKFLAISDDIISEFISVRYSVIHDSGDKENRKSILAGIQKSFNDMDDVYDKYIRDNIQYLSNDTKLLDNKKNVYKLLSIFMDNYYPLLTPTAIHTIADIPNLKNGTSCILCIVDDVTTIIPLHKNITNKLINVDLINTDGELSEYVINPEDLIIYNIDRLFVNKKIVSMCMIKVYQNYNIELDHDEHKFIIDRMFEVLHQRDSVKPFFITYRNILNMSSKDISKIFSIPKSHIIARKSVDYTKLMSLSKNKTAYPNKLYIDREYHSMFDAIDDDDILLHHPYDDYDAVVKFIQHASIDPKVVSIKQTLYRVSSESSPIINALCEAAKNDKEVTVLIEIKARFDEQRNINLTNKLKNSGVNVIYGIETLKTHCKMCLVIRASKKNVISIYSHVSSGNYNEKTAKVYTDISYFTSKRKIGFDLISIFNILSGSSSPDEKLNRVYYAPVNLRKNINKMIDKEISKGADGYIFMKVNSLSDKDIVDKLYEASDAGVKIEIICRGICSIKAIGNISIKSIVGEYLEHSRIYKFGKTESKYFISSADLLTRNLDRRVEILVNISDSPIKDKLEKIINVLLEDEVNSFIMNENGEYSLPLLDEGNNSHVDLYGI